jgi:hypothetical protein
MTQSTRIQNKRKARRFWEQHINRWKESGIKQTEYCRINGLSPKSFTYWKCKLKKEPETTTFFPITLKTSPTLQNPIKHEALKLICNDKYRVEIGDDFSSTTLTRLIRTLEGL